MKTLSERISMMLLTELLSILCRLIKSTSSRYYKVQSVEVEKFFLDFALIDIERSEVKIYEYLFKKENQSMLCKEVDSLLESLKDESCSRATIFDDIEFLQQIVASALWKYRLPLSPQLEDFARDFDRIDDESERLRVISEFKK